MKRILFLTFALISFHNNIYSQYFIIAHSNYKEKDGVACVWYNQKFYDVKWYGTENSSIKNKRWRITEVDECSIGGPKSNFKEDLRNSKKAEKVIISEIAKGKRKFPIHP